MLAPSSQPIKSSVVAAVHLLSIELAAGATLPTKAAEAIELAGAGRSQTYTMLARLRDGIETLARPAGRPAEPTAGADTLVKLSVSVITFLKQHPGCCSITGDRAVYHEDFRLFVVEMFAPGGRAANIPIKQVADAIAVPLGTLKDWLHCALSSPSSTEDPELERSQIEPAFSTTQPQIAMLLAEYPNWKGNMSSFCEYANTELRLPFGRGFITTVLVAAGLHSPKPRNRPHQAPWSRGSMRLGFPGMQWFGDGKQIKITLHDQTHSFNLEVFVDGGSSAAVGAIVTDTEDARAVVDAFHDGLNTVDGEVPMAVTLDNRPSNDAPEVEQTLSCSKLLHATPGRGQAKAPVEGLFGLLEQVLPSPIFVAGEQDREIAGSIANLIVRALLLGKNGRPSRRLGGLSPAESYRNARPTEEQIEEAKKWILELRRREKVARMSRERRADPIRLELLRTELQRLGINDPKGSIALSLAGYSMDAILTGIAIFEAKQTQGTLPKDCQPARYLGGIIRNTDERQFLELMGRKLLALRLSVSDKQLTPLRADATEIAAAADGPADRACAFIDRALHADCTLIFRFWSSRAIDAMADLPESEVAAMSTHVRRLLAASFRTDIRRRERFLADLLAASVPVAA